MKDGLFFGAFMFVAAMTVLYIINVFMRRDQRKAR